MLQAMLFINKVRNSKIKDFYWGQAWFSITHDFANYIVARESEIYDMYNHGFFNDEIFMQTYLMNSKFAENHATAYSYARLIDSDRGKPYTWTSKEFDEIMASKALFSRKFSMKKDAEVIEKIVESITSS